MPKVSVIIPTYNRAQFLRSAIERALNQTFKDMEIIVVDDNSTDHTQEVVRSFKDKRIIYLQNKRNKGPSGSRNTGILASNGKYIALLDDDDEWLSQKIEQQVLLLENSTPKICCVHSNSLNANKLTGKAFNVKHNAEKSKGNLLYHLSVTNPIHTSTVLIRRKCLDEVGLFDESMRCMEDRDLWIKLSMYWDFEYISEPLAIRYNHRQGRLSQNPEGQISAIDKLLERYFFLFKNNKKSLSDLYIFQGIQYFKINKMKCGRQSILKGIKIFPFNKVVYFHLFLSFFGPSFYQSIRHLFNR